MGMGYQDLVKRNQKVAPTTPSAAPDPVPLPEPVSQPTINKPPDTTAPAYGFEPVNAPNLSGVTKATDPISFIRQYQRANAASPQAVQDLFRQLQSVYGINPYSYNGTPSGNEIDYNGKRKVYSEGGNSWYDPDGLSDDGGGGGSVQPSGTFSPTAAYGIPTLSGGGSSSPSALDSALQDAILKLLGTNLSVDPNELRKSPEFRAKQLASQRAEERQRAQLAEEAAGGGWSASGGFNTKLTGLRQARGEGESDFLGNLATQRMQYNRDSLIAGIQAATSVGQFDKAQQLQRELADLDAAIKRATLEQQDKQFGLGLGYNYDALNANLNDSATRALLGL